MPYIRRVEYKWYYSFIKIFNMDESIQEENLKKRMR